MSTPNHQATILELLGKYFKKTLQPHQYQPILTDLRRCHPELLRDCLVEAVEATDKDPAAPPEEPSRAALMRIYNRKTKEMAAMFPFLMATEGALRGQLACEMYRIFGTDQWWLPYCAALNSGKEFKDVTDINGVPVPGSKFSNSVGKIIMSINAKDGKNAATITCGLEFLSEATFGQLRYLGEHSWAQIMQVFRGKKGDIPQIVKQDFINLTKEILDMRNDLYHHRPISNQQKCVEACERLLDHFDHHLGAFDHAISQAVYVRPEFKVDRKPRHDIIVAV
ncbi:hypothetical protein [Ensifer adhaerens]|uniref:hypothetical protein n=1 Tax=Ensifer adhaerens TaxID=106592 RepID=UPI0008073792|nr:hypothetical protein [Ensifer adhaerens]